MSSQAVTNTHDANVVLSELSRKKIRTKPAATKDIPSVIHPRLFRALEVLCRDALRYGDNAKGVRDAVGGLLNSMRTQAYQEFGFDTPDITTIAGLLERTDPSKAINEHRPEKDPIAVLRQQAHLDQDQEDAALFIREVWTGFERYLAVAARSYEHKSYTAQSRALDPISVMGARLLNEWHFIYQPWYESAKNRFAKRQNSGMIPKVRIVLHVVQVCIFPGDLDRRERLKRGTSLSVLQAELTGLSNLMEKVDVAKIARPDDDHVGDVP